MKAKFIVTIDLGGTNLKIALIDLRYRLIKRQALSTQSFLTKQRLISSLCSAVEAMILGAGLRKGDILGVGLGLPGPVDADKGIVHFLPNIPGWKEVALKKILEKRLKLAVYLDNDAKLMTLAEHRLGAAAGFRNAVCLTLGTGVGAGIIIGNELYRGRDNASAEIGHLPINEKGPRCNCGGIACLEAYIGNRRILKRARDSFGNRISLERLAFLAKKGNSKARSVWLEVAGHLGVALAAAANLLNPECIVIGGGVAGAGEALFSETKKVLKKRGMPTQVKGIELRKARLGNNAGLIGAAIMVAEGKEK